VQSAHPVIRGASECLLTFVQAGAIIDYENGLRVARSKDTRSETPWYEDSGDGIPHSGSMPAGGDGTLGSNISL